MGAFLKVVIGDDACNQSPRRFTSRRKSDPATSADGEGATAMPVRNARSPPREADSRRCAGPTVTSLARRLTQLSQQWLVAGSPLPRVALEGRRDREWRGFISRKPGRYWPKVQLTAPAGRAACIWGCAKVVAALNITHSQRWVPRRLEVAGMSPQRHSVMCEAWHARCNRWRECRCARQKHPVR
jgi:hypothetical protein